MRELLWLVKRTKKIGLGIIQTNNEIKDIMEVMVSLENRGTLLKETSRTITSQEE